MKFQHAGWGVLAALLTGTVPAGAQRMDDRAAHPYIRASGEANVSAKPDQARISIGVVTQAASAQEAGTQNAKQTEAVLAQLRKALGTAGEVRTVSYSVTPNYRYPREGGQPAITGYTASNTVEATVNDLALVGKAIDLATQSGANNIQQLRFTLKNEQPVRAQALRQAATEARANAEAIAGGLGLRIVRVLAVEEGTPEVIRPMRMMAMAAGQTAGPPATQVEPGTIEIHATVSLQVEIGQ